MSKQLETLSADSLTSVTGGAGFWSDLKDAGAGALNIVKNPVGAVYNGVKGVAGARDQGHSWGDSVANGLVRAGGIQSAPDLSKIPAK